tara:strand:+ start:276 stop:419 length:144 start_codon:yes stop_codon:yes gene_type:complete
VPIKPDKDTNNNIVGEEEVVGGDNVDHNVGFGNAYYFDVNQRLHSYR